jgi:hypothetical protein
MARELDLNLARGDSAGNNSVRIPQLNQQKVVSQLPNSPRMQPVQISNDIGKALSGMGGALGDATKAAQFADATDLRTQEFEVQQEKEKQTLSAQKAVSESSLSLISHFQESQAAVEPGAVGFTGKITKDIDTHIEAATKDATPYYKKQYETSMVGVRQHLIAKGQEYEYGEGLKLEVDNVNKGLENSQKIVYADPALFEQELTRWGKTIADNTRFNPEAKRTMIESVRKQLTWAAGAKAIEGNPQVWNATLNPYSPKNNPNAVPGANGVTEFRAQKTDYDASTWEKRPDGSAKGSGFLGVLKRPDGGVSTEISVGVTIDGKQVDVPTLVPTLTKAEVKTLLTLKDDQKVPDSIVKKAAEFARTRIKDGKPVFAQPGEEGDIVSAKPAAGANGTPASAAATGPASFDGVMGFIFKKEGGYNADDGNGHPVNFGINQGANPDIDVKNLTKEKAAEIYKTRYWKAINGDTLPPATALMAMDAAVNQGVGFAQEILAKSGGDVTKMAQLRKERYESIIAANPAKEKYRANWMKRLNEASAQAGAASGSAGSSESGMPAAPVGRVKIGQPWFDLATFDEQQKFRQYAEAQSGKLETEMAKQRQEIASSLELETRNIGEMVSRGVAPQGQPKSLADFQAAYQNPERAIQAHAAYENAWNTAQETSKYNGLPTAKLVEVIKETAPSANDPDFAVKSNLQQIRMQSAASIITARQKDPWGFAQATGDFNAGLADPTKKDFSDVIKRRAAALPQMIEKYGLTSASVMTSAEATNLSDRMAMMPADDRVALLKTLRQSIGDDTAYATLLNAIRPDSPVTVMAGNIAAVGGTVRIGSENITTDKIASRLARGEDLLNPRGVDKKADGTKSAFPMPKEQDMRSEWTEMVGNAYAGYPDAEAHAYQAYRAYYAARASEKGINDGIVNGELQGEAITAATGGIGSIDPNGMMNSYKLILPYGMPGDVFKDKSAQLWKQVGPANGYTKHTIDDLRLIPTGENGRYVVAGADMLPLPGKNNKPIILDYLAKPAAAPRRDN